jgi:hypothetical protein
MNKILASLASITAVCLATAPSFAQSSGHTPPPPSSHTPSMGGAPVSQAPAPSMGGGGSSAPAPAPAPSTGGGGTGPGANNSNYGGTNNSSSAPAPRVGGGSGGGGTVGYSPSVLAQAQSLQQRLSAARAATEQGSEAPIETIPVAPDVSAPPNIKVIRGRG